MTTIARATIGRMAQAVTIAREKRCGAIQSTSLPVAINVWVAAARAFERIHKHCKERTKP